MYNVQIVINPDVFFLQNNYITTQSNYALVLAVAAHVVVVYFLFLIFMCILAVVVTTVVHHLHCRSENNPTAAMPIWVSKTIHGNFVSQIYLQHNIYAFLLRILLP